MACRFKYWLRCQDNTVELEIHALKNKTDLLFCRLRVGVWGATAHSGYDAVTPRLSMEPSGTATIPRDTLGLAACPWAAKSLGAYTPPTVHPSPDP